MFCNYYVKNFDGEECLYLYIDDAYEFARFGKNDKKSFMDKVIDYININKINFNGKKIVIVVNGLILGTFFLAASLGSIKPSTTDNTIYVDKVFLNTYNEDNKIEDITVIEKEKDDKKLVINEDNVTSDNSITNNNNNNNNNNNKVINKDNNVDKNIINNESKPKVVEDTPKVEEKNDNNLESNNESTPPNTNDQLIQDNKDNIEQLPPATSNKTMVTIYRSNGTVEEIPLEVYLIGVVGAEMPASFNTEALKVQAIIARTYALRAMEKGITLTDTVSTQTYKDNSQLKTMWGNSYDMYYEKIRNAVNSTVDMKIKYNNELIQALYFSCSNGYTEDAYNVWGNFVPYLKSIKNDWDVSSSAYSREVILSYDELSRLLGFNIDDATSFNINNKNESNRVSSVSISYMNYSGVELRGKLSLRSADFDIERVENGLKFVTRGYGHGVGLSQYGANGMANAGYNYSQIINYYYPGVSIVK